MLDLRSGVDLGEASVAEGGCSFAARSGLNADRGRESLVLASELLLPSEKMEEMRLAMVTLRLDMLGLSFYAARCLTILESLGGESADRQSSI